MLLFTEKNWGLINMMTKYVFPSPFQIPFMLSNFKWLNVFSIQHLF